MSMNAGQRLGPYEIVAAIGAGGMGEVYRARDTRLDRTVAIKVLPSHLSSDPDFKQRFEREARAISSLNHPNICTLYDVGSQGGVDYLVMEHLEGETLADRIMRGALPLAELVKIGGETADALERAHRAGIVHRDLKPGNIMLTKSGAKLLDFGLAKPAAIGAAAASGSAPLLSAAMTANTSPSPLTPHSPLTSAGALVGTIQYMSPEQLQGIEADARADVFALGSVLYEMATGKRPFEGKSQIKVASAILEDDPPAPSSIQPSVSAALEQLIRACHAKDRDQRMQSALDVKLHLLWIGQSAVTPRVDDSKLRGSVSRNVLFAASLLIVAWLGLLFYVFSRPAAPAAQAMRFSVQSPEPYPSFWTHVDFTPDGRNIIFDAQIAGTTSLWIRPIDGTEARRMEGTDRGVNPFTSPDSRFVGFFTDDGSGSLKKAPVAGGPAETVATLPRGPMPPTGAWSPDGTILVSNGSEFYRVSASGGTPAKMEFKDAKGNIVRGVQPDFLPDGDHFLFLSEPTDKIVTVASLRSGRTQDLFPADARASYASGYILYVREGTLMARAFDAARLRVTGDPVALATDLHYFAALGMAQYGVSTTGSVIYYAGVKPERLLWVDRGGKTLGEVATGIVSASPSSTEDFSQFALSRDGSRIAVPIWDSRRSGGDLWITEVARNASTRLTSAGNAVFPQWSPTGDAVVYSIIAGSPPALRLQSLNSQTAEELVPRGSVQLAWEWSRDGEYLLYSDGNDLFALPMRGERKPVPIASNSGTIEWARFSPDRKWIAYDAQEGGGSQVYVIPFQSQGERRPVSTQGGSRPRWRDDGRELYYVAPDRTIISVPVTPGAALQLGTPTPLFHANPLADVGYAPSPDGQRFLVNSADTGFQPPTVVLNWPTEVKAKERETKTKQ